jgi:small conductance mechanosensitive channel
MDTTFLDINGMLARVADLVAAWGLKVLAALAVFIVGRVAARWIRRGVRSALERSKMDPTLVPFVSSLVYYAVVAFVVIAVLGMVGIQTASLVAVLGAAGLAVGLALQGTLSNFASGVMLLVFRPFSKGDYVEVAGTAGSVEAVGIFTTTLTTPDNVGIVVPNSGVWGQTIKNYAAKPTRRVDLVVGISYSDDIQVAIDTIKRVLGGDARVLPDPAPVVEVNELADSSVNLVVRPWCNRVDYWPLRFELTRTLKEELERAGCSIPFPQRDVHVHEVRGSAA